MKKIVVLLSLVIFMLLPITSYADNSDGKYFPDAEYWTNITATEAQNLIDDKNADDSFVFVYYRDTCSYSTSMLPLIHYYSTINDINFYALEQNSMDTWASWSWRSVVPKSEIIFPLVVVYNKQQEIMVGDSDVHSDEEFRALIASAKLNFNFSSEIKVKIDATQIDFNGKTVETDVPATIINDRTMLPVRVISELFGARVEYINKDVNNRFRVIITRGNRRIYLYEKYKKIDIQITGGKSEQLSVDVAPVIKEGRTLVPVRALAEALGFSVSWDEVNRQAVLCLT